MGLPAVVPYNHEMGFPVRGLAGVALLASIGAGCATAQARVPVEAPVVALAPPPPPPRLVEPYDPPEVAARVDPPPASAQAGAAPGRGSTPTPAAPRPRPEAAPPVTTSAAPAVLRPAGSEAKAQASIRALLERASRDLSRVSYQSLDADGRVQHDTARRFMQQAESALASGNLMFAGKLADKAASMAAVLVR